MFGEVTRLPAIGLPEPEKSLYSKRGLRALLKIYLKNHTLLRRNINLGSLRQAYKINEFRE